ncbi:MAG: hypothetical protein K5765_06995 [Clostridia bacterium]|nr:hypothetical protein [Clostridia bacterium]
MSLVLGRFEQDNIIVEYEWDKYAPHYVVFVGRKWKDSSVCTIWTNRYATVEQAKRSFQRQVRMVKKGEIQ